MSAYVLFCQLLNFFVTICRILFVIFFAVIFVTLQPKYMERLFGLLHNNYYDACPRGGMFTNRFHYRTSRNPLAHPFPQVVIILTFSISLHHTSFPVFTLFFFISTLISWSQIHSLSPFIFPFDFLSNNPTPYLINPLIFLPYFYHISPYFSYIPLHFTTILSINHQFSHRFSLTLKFIA